VRATRSDLGLDAGGAQLGGISLAVPANGRRILALRGAKLANT